MYAYSAGSPGAFAGPPSPSGFGALAPASARGPIRLSEIAAALALPAGGYPIIRARLLEAQSFVAQMTEATVAAGESAYMQAYAQAQVLGQPIPALKSLTVAAAATPTTSTPATVAPGAVTGAITSITKTIADLFAPKSPVRVIDTTPAPTSPVDFRRSAPPVAQAVWSALERPVGPLPLWQWMALGGASVVAIGVAAKLLKVAAIGGTVAAGAYGLVTYQRWQSAQRAQGSPL